MNASTSASLLEDQQAAKRGCVHNVTQQDVKNQVCTISFRAENKLRHLFVKFLVVLYFYSLVFP